MMSKSVSKVKETYNEKVGDKSIKTELKWDDEKLRWDLLDFALLEPIIYRYTVGAQKYEPNSWKNLANGKERYFSACMRHLSCMRQGEQADPDPRFAKYPSHCAAAIWNLLAVLYFEQQEEKSKAE
jgi:hypothetical protein